MITKDKIISQRETFKEANQNTKMNMLYDAVIELNDRFTRKRDIEAVISFLGSVGGGFIAMLAYIKLFTKGILP
jgi:hypothetical protein